MQQPVAKMEGSPFRVRGVFWSWKLAKAEEETSNIELIGTNCNRGAAKKPDVV